MRILFMGTPDFAVPSLRQLLEDGHEIVGVITQTDKPKGRGHKLAPPPVKELALERGLPVYQPKSLRNDEGLALVKGLAPELIIVIAYGKILPPAVLAVPPRGCINVHASLLPKYRGAGPIQWSVLNGETVTGVTTMMMAEGIDTGDILLRAETPIGENETAGELTDRLAELGAKTLSQTLHLLERGELSPQKQDDALSCYAPMLEKSMSWIDFGKSAQDLHNLIRGLSPWPCAETTYQGKRLKVYRSERVETFEAPGTESACAIGVIGACPGQVLDPKNFIVLCGDGLLKLTEVQFEGSKRMSGADFLRGHPCAPEETLGK